MISPGDVARLRERAPTPDSPVLSVYLDVDQSRAVNLNRQFVTALRARLRALEQPMLGVERETLRADVARVLRFLDEYQPGAKTLVAFADASADFFWWAELHAAVPPDVRWEPTPNVGPLLEAFSAHPRYAVVLADKAQARLLTVALGEIEEEREALAAAEVRHKNASGTDHWRSQMHFQRQDDIHVHWHLRRVCEVLQDLARTRAVDHVVLAGPAEMTAELARLLPRPLADRVAGTLRLPIDASRDRLLQEMTALGARLAQEREAARLAQLLDRGAVGLDATLSALQERRVRMLFRAEGFEARGGECERCQALFPSDGGGTRCAYCGERLRSVDDLVRRAMARAAGSGAAVQTVHGDAASRLLDAGGIGAILRF
jgi:peptide chain release factor subunit 1